MIIFDNGRMRTLALILLPLLIVATGTIWNTHSILNAISISVDKQEDIRTWQTIQSAVHAAQQRLAGTVVDNAHWDDAALQSYGKLDFNWMMETWGVGTADINYDRMFIMQPDGTTLISFHKGESSTVAIKDYLGSSLDSVINALPADNSTFDAVSSLMNTPDGLTLLAAAPILPTSENIKIPASRSNILIFCKSLTAEYQRSLGEQYVVDGLRIGPLSASTHSGRLLNDHWGRPVAVAAWNPRNPGNAARASYLPSSLESILALLIVMLPISIVHFRTMSKLENNEKKALFAATHDVLTKLPNRIFILDHLVRHISEANRLEVALTIVDLDGFKEVNDSYNHATGDMLIRAVAAGLSSLVADQGIVARLGGDEFAIVVSGVDAASRSERIARHVLTFVKEPFEIEGKIAVIGASLGIAAVEDERVDAAELMRRADLAMYEAKAAGKNCWRRYDVSIDARRNEELSIANELRSFLAVNTFDIAYQPIVDAQSRRIVCVEALARWPAASNRRLSPDRFIPIAEQHGLIDSLGTLIMRTACRDLSEWKTLLLAINVSPLQFNNRDFVPSIWRAANEYQFDVGRLEVEITETALMRNPDNARNIIDELKQQGVSIALDDFGAGYAGLGYLRDYAFDKIKLDRSLTNAMLTEPSVQQMVQGTVLIAKGISASITAEGVETEEQAQLMRLVGCNQLQGHYFAKPMSAPELLKHLEQQERPMQALREIA